MNIMKEIFILRHAKSSWKDSYLSDFDRPLADRGIREAKKIMWLYKKK
jgi:phosphohistidine phosphatase